MDHNLIVWFGPGHEKYRPKPQQSTPFHRGQKNRLVLVELIHDERRRSGGARNPTEAKGRWRKKQHRAEPPAMAPTMVTFSPVSMYLFLLPFYSFDLLFSCILRSRIVNEQRPGAAGGADDDSDDGSLLSCKLSLFFSCPGLNPSLPLLLLHPSTIAGGGQGGTVGLPFHSFCHGIVVVLSNLCGSKLGSHVETC